MVKCCDASGAFIFSSLVEADFSMLPKKYSHTPLSPIALQISFGHSATGPRGHSFCRMSQKSTQRLGAGSPYLYHE